MKLVSACWGLGSILLPICSAQVPWIPKEDYRWLAWHSCTIAPQILNLVLDADPDE